MKIVSLSDIHGTVTHTEIPDGDIFIHAGDFCNIGGLEDVWNFNLWLKDHDIFERFFYIIVCAGNHDVCFQKAPDLARGILDNRIIYLEDKFVIINKIKIYCSPHQLPFNNWAFNLPEEKLAKKFAKIPLDTNILVSHSPPFGILDEVDNEHHGSVSLRDRVKKVKPWLHIFGHIHECGGQKIVKDNITYANVSLLDGNYREVNKPMVFEI